MAKTKIYVDGDLLVFPASAMGEDRVYLAKDPSGKVVGEFTSASDHKNWLSEIEIMGVDRRFGFEGDIEDLTREFEVRPKDIKVCKRHFERTLEEWLSACPEGDVTVYLAPKSGQPNPRHEIALRKPYKGNRKASHKPIHLMKLREWALDLPYTRKAYKWETDDLVIAGAYKNGINGYAVQPEKDLFTAYNCWMYHPDIHSEPVWSDPNVIGHLEWRDKKLIGSGRLFLLAQGGIFGDTADNYSGLDGAGYNKAWEVLNKYNHQSVECLPDAIREVCELYKCKYGSTCQYINKNGEQSVASWFDFYQEGIRLAYMVKSRNDFPHEMIDPAKEML